MACPDPKILLLSAASNIGGMERVVCGLSLQFAAQNWTVRTVFPASENAGALLEWCRGQGVEADVSPAMLDVASAHSARDMANLRRLVRSADAAVVNLHYGDNFISLRDVLAVRMAGQRNCVASVHSVTSWETLGPQKRKMTRLASYFCRAIVANSHATRDVLLSAGVPARKTHRIPCGVRVPGTLPDRAEARQRMRLPAGAFVATLAGRLVPGKRVQDLIEAAARIPDPEGRLLLAIAGDGPERAALEALSASRLKGRVVFLGRLSSMDDFYAAGDVFVLPSAMEGFGLVYLEAAFHGVPSIGTNVGGVPEAIEDGRTGLLVPPGDPVTLAASLQRLRDDPPLRLKLGLSAQARARAQFTEAVMAERYAALFRD